MIPAPADMRILDDRPLFAATDLSNHVACAHLTTQKAAIMRGERGRPNRRDPRAESLQQRGEEHERRYLELLRTRGLEIEELEGPPRGATREDLRVHCEHTRSAMMRGAHVIYQPTLYDGEWYGRADFLLRVDTPSDLGDWSYEVQDAKLAVETRASAILQLCCYAELLTPLQGSPPEYVAVIPGVREGDPAPERHRVAHYWAYYQRIKAAFAAELADTAEVHYPAPCDHCSVCDFYSECDRRRRDDDDISLVAGLTRGHRAELLGRDVATLARLAETAVPLDPPPRRGNPETYARIQAQARIQLEGRTLGSPRYEFLEPVEPERGLAILPAPDPADVFFDIEGDRHAPRGGLEYLFGLSYAKDPSRAASTPTELDYRATWAFDRTEEREQFEALMDFLVARRAAHPELHVYHYAPYETTALKRLAGTYSTRQDELDTMLREGVFVDLYRAVRQGLRCSVESYSIKKLEPFYNFEREVDLDGVGWMMRQFEVDLEMGRREEVDPKVLTDIEGYNRDDCVSTAALRDWLEQRREELAAGGIEVPRPGPPPDPPDAKAELTEAAELADALLAGLPDIEAPHTEGQKATRILAGLLGWHRREELPTWWEMYRRCELSDEELREDRACLGGLRYIGPGEEEDTHVFGFPPQEHDFAKQPGAKNPRDLKLKPKVVDVDLSNDRITLKAESLDTDPPTALVPLVLIPAGSLLTSLIDLARDVLEHGIEGADRFPAGIRLLLRQPPTGTGLDPGAPLRREGEETLDAARRVVLSMEHSVLPMQGPPGSGKTYTAAHMIAALVAAGKRVGITANSHKVITNLMERTDDVCKEIGVQPSFIRKVSGKVNQQAKIKERSTRKPVENAVKKGANVIGATAWLWATEDLAFDVDVLFVDEASQLSLANTLAASRHAKNIVLLGDPQQLDQPLQGTHPEGCDTSALGHVLGHAATIAPWQGLFLDRT